MATWRAGVELDHAQLQEMRSAVINLTNAQTLLAINAENTRAKLDLLIPKLDRIEDTLLRDRHERRGEQ
jgi:hypothetical protein